MLIGITDFDMCFLISWLCNTEIHSINKSLILDFLGLFSQLITQLMRCGKHLVTMSVLFFEELCQ